MLRQSRLSLQETVPLLAALRKICLIPCEEYTDLRQKIAVYCGKTGQ
jgi:hypothetical protein